MINPFLAEFRQLPVHQANNRIVQWHVFRDIFQADEYSSHIHLSKGQTIVGGSDADSIGPLWWVGVEVDDLKQWGNRAAVNKHAQ